MDPKEVVARFIVDKLKEYKLIGLGTGKTVKKLIEVLSEEGLLKEKIFVASSIDTELEISKREGIVITLYSGLRPQVYIDSFDFVTSDKIMIKGGGAALLREKMLYTFSKEKIFIGEESKLKDLKEYSVPVEVVPVGVSYVISAFKERGYEAKIREGNGKIGPIISDNGNIILDVIVKRENLCDFERLVKEIPAIIESGIFCKKDYEIYLANENGRISIL
ncbi:ribose 5-phosphate isomerase A [Sulfurisphaera ohwakuensis]|uniref:ribose 5-phosphate isomerase A n=1 Tax=Sulfurisphaera ohwakuensis TaxID=69656 RepID=UPI0036F22B38